MGSSGLARIRSSENGVDVDCTDSEVLESVLDELKKLVSSCRIRKYEDLSGETAFLNIDKLQGQDRAVGFWIVKQLCLQL